MRIKNANAVLRPLARISDSLTICEWRWVIGISIAGIALWTAARGFHFPDSYAAVQWLVDYGNGYVKRGFIGTIVSPLLTFKSPSEIRNLIWALSTIVLGGALLAMAAVARGILRRAASWDDELLYFGAVLVFASSSFIVFSTSVNGFFDHFLEPITIIAVYAISRRRFVVASVLSVMGFAIHEMFFLYGFPVVGFALLAQNVKDARQGRPVRRLALRSVLFLIPVVTIVVFGIVAQARLDRKTLGAIRHDALEYRAYDEGGVDNMIKHLSEDLVDSWSVQRKGSFVERLLNPAVGRVVFPAAVVLLLVAGLMLRAARQSWLTIPMVLVCLSPIAIHLIAWDTCRFTNFILFHAFISIFAISLVWKPEVSLGRAHLAGFWGLCVLVFINSAVQQVPLMKEKIDGQGLLGYRRAPQPRSFNNCRPVFANASFEAGTLAGWRATGTAFTKEQIKPKSKKMKDAHMRHWLGTWSYTKLKDHGKRVMGDLPKGKLISNPFVVDGDEIIFFIGGGRHRRSTYAALWVDGKERYRATGRNEDPMTSRYWDVRPFRGKTAHIEVVDNASGNWGHINVDGFCYVH